MPRTDLYVNFSITGDLAPFRIVAHDGSGGYKQAAAATEAVTGATSTPCTSRDIRWPRKICIVTRRGLAMRFAA